MHNALPLPLFSKLVFFFSYFFKIFWGYSSGQTIRGFEADDPLNSMIISCCGHPTMSLTFALPQNRHVHHRASAMATMYDLR